MQGLVICQPHCSKNPELLKIHIQISIHKQPHISLSLKGGLQISAWIEGCLILNRLRRLVFMVVARNKKNLNPNCEKLVNGVKSQAQ